MRSSQSGSLILCPFFSQMGRTSGKDSDSAFIIGGSLNFVSNMFGTEIKRLIRWLFSLFSISSERHHEFTIQYMSTDKRHVAAYHMTLKIHTVSLPKFFTQTP